MSWLIPYSDLTPDQQRAVQLRPDENRAIIGGPGSGKTQILLHRARHLCDLLKTPSPRFRIFVYTNALKDYIKTALKELDLPEDNVITFDHWCRLYYQKNINSKLPWDAHAKKPDFAAIRQAVTKHAGSGQKAFDFVLVDEGQDLPEYVFSLLTKISRHITVCLDNKQQIYDTGATEACIFRVLGIRRQNVNLIDAFRVCPYLVEVASQFIANPSERTAFRKQTRQPQIERETPLIYLAHDFDDEKAMLQQIVRERLLKNERIAILFPEKRQVFGFAKGLHEVGIEVEIPPQQTGTPPFATYDFTSHRPKLMTLHSAKGLTFDTIFLPRLIANAFPRRRPDEVEHLLFVAITRATRWCYFSATGDNPLAELQEKLLPLESSRQIAVRRYGAPEKTRIVAPPPVAPEPNTNIPTWL
ncbi:MAG: AAA family ATPase [Acidobacteriota bacterium]|jgi:superfamily I DNA/RNA helicase|nr:AAA family ATPase [Acidobacteriota bacterium]